MKKIGKYILLERNEFGKWLNDFKATRKIMHVQQHHTWLPQYSNFHDNHFKLCESMEAFHRQRGFTEIAQNFTTFPDGRIMVCRSLNTMPAGIRKANGGGICIENVGNFDKGHDVMTDEQAETIVEMTKLLLGRFKLSPSQKTVVYHHWFDLNTGKLKPGDESASDKTCPGTNFFKGNTKLAFEQHFLPLLKS